MTGLRSARRGIRARPSADGPAASWYVHYDIEDPPGHGTLAMLQEGFRDGFLFPERAKLTVVEFDGPRPSDRVQSRGHWFRVPTPQFREALDTAAKEIAASLPGRGTAIPAYVWLEGSVRVVVPTPNGLRERRCLLLRDAPKVIRDIAVHPDTEILRFQLGYNFLARARKEETAPYFLEVTTNSDVWFLFRRQDAPDEWRVASLASAIGLARFLEPWRRVEGFSHIDPTYHWGADEGYSPEPNPVTPLGALTEDEFRSLDRIPLSELTAGHPRVRSTLVR